MSREAFDTLVACYWKPLYKYARVGFHRTREDAEDLTQAFFTRAFEKESLASYDHAKASFRTFLRMLFDRFAGGAYYAMTALASIGLLLALRLRSR